MTSRYHIVRDRPVLLIDVTRLLEEPVCLSFPATRSSAQYKSLDYFGQKRDNHCCPRSQRDTPVGFHSRASWKVLRSIRDRICDFGVGLEARLEMLITPPSKCCFTRDCNCPIGQLQSAIMSDFLLIPFYRLRVLFLPVELMRVVKCGTESDARMNHGMGELLFFTESLTESGCTSCAIKNHSSKDGWFTDFDSFVYQRCSVFYDC